MYAVWHTQRLLNSVHCACITFFRTLSHCLLINRLRGGKKFKLLKNLEKQNKKDEVSYHYMGFCQDVDDRAT